MKQHEAFMKRCLELAQLGSGVVAPNPMVGCVIVHENRIIGEGFHQCFGEPHAEVNAINAVKDRSQLSESTLYVNLEPCAHHGKTPPCADLILASGIPRVVICNDDPFQEVAGKGVQKLKNEGVDVTSGILESEGEWLNRRFFTFHRENRPYIILKFAQTNDGFLDHYRKSETEGMPLQITGDDSNLLVHKWRSEEASILVGINTVMLDNPNLTTRHWVGKNPLRLVIDPELQITEDRYLIQDRLPTWIFNGLRNDYCENNLCYIQINDPGSFQTEILTYLHRNGIQSVMIEGGASTLSRFIQADLWDEARILTGNMRIGDGIGSPSFSGKLLSSTNVGNDLLQVYTRT